MSTLNVDAGHVSLQAWMSVPYARRHRVPIYILGFFSSGIASFLRCIISASVKCVGEVLLKL